MATTAIVPPPLLRRPDIRFPVRFVLFGVLMAVAWNVVQPTSAWLCDALADVVAWISKLLGMRAAVEPGAHVRFAEGGHEFRYVITDECTATLVLATYAAAVLAYPTDRRSRALGLVIGVPALLLVNLLRLVSLGWVGLHARASFDVVHMYWWQVFYIAGTGVIWFAWAWWTSDARAALSTAATSSSLRRRTTSLVVAAQLLAFAALGMWAHAAKFYFRVLSIPVDALVHVLWGGQIHVVSPEAQNAAATYIENYAQLAAVVALFLASPGLDLRTRLQGVVRWAVPGVIAVQVAERVWMATIQVHARTEGPGGLWHRSGAVGFVLTYVLQIGLSLVVWQVWLQRARRREERRQLRAAARRRGRGQAGNRKQKAVR